MRVFYVRINAGIILKYLKMTLMISNDASQDTSLVRVDSFYVGDHKRIPANDWF